MKTARSPQEPALFIRSDAKIEKKKKEQSRRKKTGKTHWKKFTPGGGVFGGGIFVYVKTVTPGYFDGFMLFGRKGDDGVRKTT